MATGGMWNHNVCQTKREASETTQFGGDENDDQTAQARDDDGGLGL
jgi:hypothetical protein